MRSQGSARELERRRELAVARVAEGHSQAQVGAILGVHPGTVSRWVCTARRRGADALRAKPTPGRPRKLSARQEENGPGLDRPAAHEVWFSDRPVDEPAAGGLDRTALGHPFQQQLYLVEWLRARAYTPQKPAQPARERDEAAIARWTAEDWPRLQKKREKKRLIWSSSTKAASF